MKRLPSLLLILVLFFGGGGDYLWWQEITKPPSSDSIPQPFIITPGESATRIGEILEQEGFVRSATAFRIYVQFTNQQTKIRAGDYRLAKDLSLASLVGELTRGPIAVWVTIPEGLRREEIINKVVSALGLTNDKRISFIQEFLRITKNQEGFLFPDTYLFMRTADPEEVVTKFTLTFDKKVEQTIILSAAKNNLDKDELVTLASIVERETRTSEERPVVAGILLKRLRVGMPLQIDATLQYVAATNRCSPITNHCQWWEPIKSGDKEIKSLYNTYAHPGLPPGPIANPGLSSIGAAAKPEESVYWFYLHDGQGIIHYAATVEEHQENISKFLR